MPRNVNIKPHPAVKPCPKCGNATSFVAHSARCAEDCCEVWVECTCGYDPTAESPGARFEDVMGRTSDDNVWMALRCWSDAIHSAAKSAA